MKQKVSNRYKLQKPFLDIAHCLIMGEKMANIYTWRVEALEAF